MRRWRRGERIVSGLHRTDGSNILPGMKRSAWLLLPFASLLLAGGVRAETETIDLRALAKKARPAVMLLVVSDAAGKEIATGTGFLVSSDGKLITNHHVIEKAASAVAKAENGGVFPVEGVLAADPKNDLVLLKIKGKDLPFLPLGNSEKIEVGTRIAVIGSPLGLEGTLSEGIVSAVRELMGNVKALQVTAAISPGSSGSPVMNAKGDEHHP
jgi:S1-C subfamily serine protease